MTLDATSKHYVQGVRLSGRDNNTVAESVFYVTGDKDYVMAYGIKGNLTKYTVNYQDENGNALRESDEFYGNVGDKPVVAYRYIEGYTPEVMGFTKTLSKNEAENVFTFVYNEVETEEIVVPQPGDGDGTGTGTGNEGQEGQGNQEGTGNEGQGGTGNEPEPNEPGQNEPEPDEPDSPIVVIDDPEVPLAPEPEGPDMKLIGMIGAGVLAALLLVYILFLAKKKKEEQ